MENNPHSGRENAITGESAPFHLLSAASAVARLGANPAAGLAEAEARERLGRLGPNKLASIPPRSKWLLFLDQFKNLLISNTCVFKKRRHFPVPL